MKVICTSCGKERQGFSSSPLCPCGGIYQMKPDMKYREGGFLAHYPYLDGEVSIGETVTPVAKFGDLSLKLEYFSPTFSYKDRGTKPLISWLSQNLEKGSRINEDSSGNAGASISAYGAAAGLDVNIFVPEKTVASKVAQISSYGATIHKVHGTREDVSDAAHNAPGFLASHVLNPEFRDGMREISYEIFHQFNGKMPESIFIPVSAGTLILGMISGFEHLRESGEIQEVPRIVAVQTEAVCPLCSALNGSRYNPDEPRESIADALVSRKPPLLPLMVDAVGRYGRCITVTEDEIISSREALARKGFLVEFSSATVLAAYEKSRKSGRGLLIMTGNGLKSL